MFEETPAPRPIPPPAPPPRAQVPPRAPASSPAPDSGVEAVLRSLPARLRPDDAAGWNAVFHLDLLGATESLWTVRITDGRCTVEAGLHGTPDCVVKTREKTFLGIEDGTVNPQTAFLLGKIRISNLSAMMKFVHAFRPR
jgi:putative sterol carrier protein